MNKIFVQGNLGRDAAIRETANGGKFLSLTIADNQYVKGENKTYWYDVTCANFNEKLVPYYKKGSSLTVIGSLVADLENGNDGVTRCRRIVRADSIEFQQGAKQQEGGQEGQTQQQTTQKKQVNETSNVDSMYGSRKKKEEPVPEPVVSTAGSRVDDDSEIPF